ncbi:ABC transporter transmembrane domain-containing protein [Candidatus Deianiraea vastatrix]|uniref:ABC transporter ATP-binding protein/permease n=1 Tax=Candidatus Deianiraea vastatrix TaxID=2163644 RepID=A0A5B8XGC5_9RICK|nr:ABC transporter ATP-binding protein [Candidatus Deianiraea vastatrix]QED23926.1 Putative ABC transporter ATP-binding protein/permease [Candidatus Deianiraea vastatrix]
MNNYKISSLLKAFISSYKLLFIIAIFSTIATSLIVLSFGYMVRAMVDGISSGNGHDVNIAILRLFAATCGLCFFSFCRSFFMNLIAEKFCQKSKLKIYNLILDGKISHLQNFGCEKIINTISASFVQIRAILGTSFPFLIRSSFTLIGSFIVIFYISWQLTLWVLISITILMLPAFILGRKLKKQSKIVKDYNNLSDKMIFNNILNLKFIKAFSAQNIAKEDYIANCDKILKQERQRLILRSFFISLCMFAVVGAVLIAVYFGTKQIALSQISGGKLTAFMVYAIMIAFGLGGVSEHGAEFYQIKNAWKKIMEITESIEKEEYSDGKKPDNAITSINVSNFSFRFQSDKREAILIPEFHIKSGQIALFSTKSGSGKSSFFDMICKYIEIEKGKIFIDNIDITEINPIELRGKISYCMQNAIVMEKTLLENFHYSGCRDIKLISSVMRDLNIEYLTDKFNENVANFMLSGGEKTRIMIAICLLRGGDLMIFDEPTNGLDAENSSKIISVIKKYCSGKITFISSHDANVKDLLGENALHIDITKSELY